MAKKTRQSIIANYFKTDEMLNEAKGYMPPDEFCDLIKRCITQFTRDLTELANNDLRDLEKAQRRRKQRAK
jgi:hypothetical protein